jgi:hypothetical protein
MGVRSGLGGGDRVANSVEMIVAMDQEITGDPGFFPTARNPRPKVRPSMIGYIGS